MAAPVVAVFQPRCRWMEERRVRSMWTKAYVRPMVRAAWRTSSRISTGVEVMADGQGSRLRNGDVG